MRVALLAAVLFACAGSATPPSTTSFELPTGTWILEAGAPILSSNPATLWFENDGGTAVVGEGPCNIFGSEIEITATSLHVVGISMTMVSCEDEIMESEAQFLRKLQAASSWQHDGEKLRIQGEEGTLVFAPGMIP